MLPTASFPICLGSEASMPSSLAPHLGTEKVPNCKLPGKPAWPDRQVCEVVGNIPLGPVLVEPQDQMRHK